MYNEQSVQLVQLLLWPLVRVVNFSVDEVEEGDLWVEGKQPIFAIVLFLLVLQGEFGEDACSAMGLVVVLLSRIYICRDATSYLGRGCDKAVRSS